MTFNINLILTELFRDVYRSSLIENESPQFIPKNHSLDIKIKMFTKVFVSYLTIFGWKDKYSSWSWLFLSKGGHLESSYGKRLPLGVLLTLASQQSCFWTIWVMAREWTCQPSALWKFTPSWEIAGFMNPNKDPILQPWQRDLPRYWRSIRQRYWIIDILLDRSI